VSTSNNRTIFTAAALAGAAVVTKQAGAIAIAPLAAVVLSVAIQGRIRPGAVALLFGISLLPIAMFLIIYLPIEADVTGNLSYLQSLASDRGPTLEGAYAMLRQMWSPVFLLILGAIAFLNVVRLRTLDGAVGFLFLVLAIIGAFIFADCCSYGARNGWWIISLLVVSVVFALAPLDKWISSIEPSGIDSGRMALSMSVFVFSVALSSLMLLISNEEAAQAQEKFQWRILWPDVNALIRSNLPIIRDGKIISPYQLVGFLPGLSKQYVRCYPNGDDCVLETIQGAERSFLLLSDKEGFPSLVDRLGNVDLLGEAGGWRLYGPIEPSFAN
jgi:hypothetical protein